MMEKQEPKPKKDKKKAAPNHMSIKSILGGDILANDFFKIPEVEKSKDPKPEEQEQEQEENAKN